MTRSQRYSPFKLVFRNQSICGKKLAQCLRPEITVYFFVTIHIRDFFFTTIHHPKSNVVETGQKKQTHLIKKKTTYIIIPAQDLKVPGGWGSQTSRQSACEGGKVVTPYPLTTFSAPLPQGILQVLISVTGWVNLRAILHPEWLCHNTIGNRTRDFLACSVVPQPTAPPRAPIHIYKC